MIYEEELDIVITCCKGSIIVVCSDCSGVCSHDVLDQLEQQPDSVRYF